MAVFWNFLQDHRYFKERKRSEHLESRVNALEKEIADQRDLMKKLLHKLEVHLGDDVNGDGQIGMPKPTHLKIRQTRDNKRVRKQISKHGYR